VAEAAVDLTLDKLPKALAVEQLDAILGMVNEALRAQLEERIMEHREYRSELFRGIYKKGEAEGRAKGEAKGEVKGRAEGRAEGEAKGKAESILAVLVARGIPVSDAIRARILGCRELGMLDTWIQRAAVVSTAAAVVRTTPPPARRAVRRVRKG
jgi:hypothetical protein